MCDVVLGGMYSPDFYCLPAVLGLEPRMLCLLGKHPTTKSHPPALFNFLNLSVYFLVGHGFEIRASRLQSRCSIA
jgi:hypothetical protein